MSGPADVRGVIRATIEQLRASGDTGMVEHLLETDAAVAELIEASIEFRAGIAALVICQEQEAPQDIYAAVAERFQKAADRQETALARVGSAS